MPKRKRRYSKKRNKGKRYRRRYRRRKFTFPRTLPAIRTKARVRFRYADSDFKLTSTTGVMVGHGFVANGCFDPDATGVGHQPYGWDQWSPYFHNYVVVGSKIRAYVTTDGTVNGTTGIYLDDDNSAPNNTGWMIESKRGSFSIINQQRSSAKTRSAYSPKKFYNIRDIRDNVDRLGSNTSSNPSEKVFYIVWFQSEALTSATCRFTVVIDYIVDFSQPLSTGQS